MGEIVYTVVFEWKDYRDPSHEFVGVFSSPDKAKEGAQTHYARTDGTFEWYEDGGIYRARADKDKTYTIRPYALDRVSKEE